MAIGIAVGCTPAIAAIFRQESKPFAKVFASIRSWISSRTSFRSETSRQSYEGKEAVQWRSENYIELEEGAGRPK